MIRITATAALLLSAVAPVRAEPPKAAVFDFQYSNLSPVPDDPADTARLKRVSDEFRSLLASTGLFTVVPTDPLKAEVAKGPELRQCNGCAETFARRLGADVAITGEVQKVSNLILNLNVYVKPLSGQAVEKAYSVDLRGDTDESFDRGIRFLVRNNMEGDNSLAHH